MAVCVVSPHEQVVVLSRKASNTNLPARFIYVLAQRASGKYLVEHLTTTLVRLAVCRDFRVKLRSEFRVQILVHADEVVFIHVLAQRASGKYLVEHLTTTLVRLAVCRDFRVKQIF